MKSARRRVTHLTDRMPNDYIDPGRLDRWDALTVDDGDGEDVEDGLCPFAIASSSSASDTSRYIVDVLAFYWAAQKRKSSWLGKLSSARVPLGIRASFADGKTLLVDRDIAYAVNHLLHSVSSDTRKRTLTFINKQLSCYLQVQTLAVEKYGYIYGTS